MAHGAWRMSVWLGCVCVCVCGVRDERLDLNWLICERASGWSSNVSYLHLCVCGSDIICKFNLSSSNGIYTTGGRERPALSCVFFTTNFYGLCIVYSLCPPATKSQSPIRRTPALCLSRIADCQLAATLWLRRAHKKVIKFLFTLVIGSEKH